MGLAGNSWPDEMSGQAGSEASVLRGRPASMRCRSGGVFQWKSTSAEGYFRSAGAALGRGTKGATADTSRSFRTLEAEAVERVTQSLLSAFDPDSFVP